MEPVAFVSDATWSELNPVAMSGVIKPLTGIDDAIREFYSLSLLDFLPLLVLLFLW